MNATGRDSIRHLVQRGRERLAATQIPIILKRYNDGKPLHTLVAQRFRL